MMSVDEMMRGPFERWDEPDEPATPDEPERAPVILIVPAILIGTQVQARTAAGNLISGLLRDGGQVETAGGYLFDVTAETVDAAGLAPSSACKRVASDQSLHDAHRRAALAELYADRSGKAPRVDPLPGMLPAELREEMRTSRLPRARAETIRMIALWNAEHPEHAVTTGAAGAKDAWWDALAFDLEVGTMRMTDFLFADIRVVADPSITPATIQITGQRGPTGETGGGPGDG